MEKVIDKKHAIKMMERLFKSRFHRMHYRIILISGADNKRIPIHRSVLIAASKYFEALLGPNFHERNHDEFTLDGADGATVQIIVNFCYTGHINLTEANVGQIVAVASSVQLDLLEEKCRTFYNDKLGAYNSVRTLMFADKYSSLELRQRALATICEGFNMLKTKGIQELTPQLLEEVLKCDKIEATEDLVFTRLLEWFQWSEVERGAHMPQLLKWIRLEHITPTFLNEKLDPIYNRFHCSDLLNAERERRASNPELNTVIQRNQSIWCVQETLPFINIKKYFRTLNRFELVRQIDAAGLTDMGLVVHRNKVYILGGMRASKDMCTNSVHVINLITRVWTILPRMNEPRDRFASLSCGKFIYVFGGISNKGIINSCERFDTENNSWKVIKPLKVGRYWSSAAVLNGYIYVVGGVVRSNSGNGFEMTNAVEMYDSICDEWVQLEAMEHAVKKCVLIASNGSLSAMSHYRIEKYVPEANGWRSIDFYSTAVSGIDIDGEMHVITSSMQFGRIRFDQENYAHILPITEAQPMHRQGQILLFRE